MAAHFANSEPWRANHLSLGRVVVRGSGVCATTAPVLSRAHAIVAWAGQGGNLRFILFRYFGEVMSKSRHWDRPEGHRALMSNYYRMHAPIYDFTRWMFLFGRKQIIADLRLKRGEVVVEVGCGTGKNFSAILNAI